MSQAINSLAFHGDMISFRVGVIEIAVICIRPDAAYRVSVRYASTGAEDPQLSRSYPDEATARAVARRTTEVFAGGLTITQAVAA